jgi:hypothetical protein
MALELTQCQKIFLGSKALADSLTAICEPIVFKLSDPRRLTTL